MFGLRRYFLLDPSVTFLDHGSSSAALRPVFQSYQRWHSKLERQPVDLLGRRFSHLMRSARQSLAATKAADADNLVYTTNVTDSLNLVARSLELGPSDEVLIVDHEYGALDLSGACICRIASRNIIRLMIPTPFRFFENIDGCCCADTCHS